MYTKTIHNAKEAAELASQLLKRFAVADAKPIEVKISEAKRNSDQNALFHSLCQQAAEKSNSQEPQTAKAEWWKNEFKAKLGKKEVHFDLNDQPTIFVISTTRYSKSEMASFVDKIIAYCDTDFGISLEIK